MVFLKNTEAQVSVLVLLFWDEAQVMVILKYSSESKDKQDGTLLV